MSAFLYGIGLQWKLDIRNKGVLLTYYVVPLAFFGFMGGIFSSIVPDANLTLIQSMSVFGVSMGAFLGTASTVSEGCGKELKKAYKAGKVPLWTVVVNNIISGFVHLMIMSAAIYIIAPLAFDAVTPDKPVLYFVDLAIFVLTSLITGALLGLHVNSSAKLTLISQLLFLPSVMLSGIMFSSSLLPTALQYVGKVLPATWGFINMCGSGFSISDTLPLLIVIAVTCIGCAVRLQILKRKN